MVMSTEFHANFPVACSRHHTVSESCLRSTLLVALFVAAGAAAPVGDLSGQVAVPPTRALEPPDAVSLQGFTRIGSIRELPDGRVLLTDLSENQLYLLDFAREQTETIGTVGDGPSEYRTIGWLFPLTPDSTLLTDRSTNRWLVIDGDEIVGALSGERTLNRRFRSRLWGVGPSGKVLGSVPQPSPERRFADRRAAVLAPWSGVGDVPSDRRTVAVLQAEGENQMSCLVVRGSTGGAVPAGSRPDPTCHFYPESEQALLFPDGWIALARVRPYRVVWNSPDGRTTGGDPLPRQPVAATMREKCAVYVGWANAAALEACGSEELDDFAWTDEIPPFPTDQIDVCRGCRALVADASPPLMATPEGFLLVRRTPTAERTDSRYDLINRGGALISTIVLPLNEAIVGFGPGTVYSVQRDDLDLLWLRKHPWDLD